MLTEVETEELLGGCPQTLKSLVDKGIWKMVSEESEKKGGEKAMMEDGAIRVPGMDVPESVSILADRTAEIRETNNLLEYALYRRRHLARVLREDKMLAEDNANLLMDVAEIEDGVKNQ